MVLGRSIVVVAFLFLPLQINADEWPQFGGPNRNGISSETGLLQEWPEAGPNLAWSVQGLGVGYSSLSIVGKQIFTIGDKGDDQYVFALSRETGEQIWSQRIGPANPGGYPGSRSTPTFDNGKLYVMSTEAQVFCLAASDGSVEWQKDLVAEFDAALMQAMGQYDWQFSESPLVDGDKVVVTPGSKNAVVVALNKTNGELVWKTELPEIQYEHGADGGGYSSMVVAEIDGTRQYIQLFGRGVIGVDAVSGKYLWGYNKIANKIANVPTPVVTGNHVFVSTGYQTGSALLEIREQEGEWLVTEKYFLSSRVFQNHHGGFVLHQGHIYGGHGHKLGFPICLNLETGEVAWGPIRNRGKGSASVTMADGRLYMRYENGLMVLVEVTPTGYEEKGSFMIRDVKAKSWSRPVISGGQMFLKEQDVLYCYDISKTPESP